MSYKQQLLDAMLYEIDVIKHLAAKVPAGSLEYRPTAGQRSTLELLRYVTTCAALPVEGAISGNWDHAPAQSAAAQTLQLGDIPDAMDAQARRLKELLEPFTDADLLERESALPWGAPASLGACIMMMGVKTLTAYRMQLFLYCKQAGDAELWTPNCWMGIDRERPAPAAAE